MTYNFINNSKFPFITVGNVVSLFYQIIGSRMLWFVTNTSPSAPRGGGPYKEYVIVSVIKLTVFAVYVYPGFSFRQKFYFRNPSTKFW